MKKIKLKFGVSVIKQLKKTSAIHSNLTLDDIRKSIEQLKTERKITFDKPLGLHPDTGGLYRLSDTCYGNKAAYQAFEKALMLKMNNYSLPKTFLPTSKEE